MGSDTSKPARKGSSRASSLNFVSGPESGAENNAGLAPEIRVGTSISCNENLLNAGGVPQQTGSKLSIDNSRSRSGSANSATITSKTPKKPALILKYRQLVQSCFQNPHENLGRRILKRTAEKRKDFARFYIGLSADQKDELEERIKGFLKKCVLNVDSIGMIQKLAEEFGGHFVQYRLVSFKADYFSSIADATITECVFLDNAVHPTHQTFNAFSQLITMIFTAVRDGFYQEMRKNRRTSTSFSTGSNGSSRHKKGTLEPCSHETSREASPLRSASPNADESSSLNSSGFITDSLSQPVSRKTSLTRKVSFPHKMSLNTRQDVTEEARSNRILRKASSTEIPSVMRKKSVQNTSSEENLKTETHNGLLKPPTNI